MLAECFPFLKIYLEDDHVTDLNYAGKCLWIDHLYQGRFCLELDLSDEEVYHMAQQFSNRVNRHFNLQYPLLETDLECFRISLIHPSLCGHVSISIRKSAPFCRITEKSLLDKNGLSKTALDFLKRVIKNGKNVMISGIPGAGKTEFLKFLTNYIEETERVITIEDSYELHYASLHPNRDVVAMKVHPHFDYAQAIKASLRQRADRILLSEVRGLEVVDLLTAASSGVSVMSTIHAVSAYDIPKRIQTLIPSEREDLRSNVERLLNVGIHMTMKQTDKGMIRFVREIVYYGHEETYLIYDAKDKRDARKMPKEVREAIKEYQI